MNELVQAATSLPNLHPALVHFPIALLPVALSFDLLGCVRRTDWAVHGATLLWGLTLAATGAAYWTGRLAADSLSALAPQVQVQIARHSDWGLYSLWAIGVVAALRLVVAVRSRPRGLDWSRGVRWGLLAAGTAVFGLVIWTADLGGALVFRHGVAVRAAAGRPPVPSPARLTHDDADQLPPAARLSRDADGSLTWLPLPADGAALGSILVPEPTGSLDGVTPLPAEEGTEGLGLAVDGRTMLLLPGAFDDVQIDAVLDVSGFEGTFGLVHHAQSVDTVGMFLLATSGTARLVKLEAGSARALDEQTIALPQTPIEFAVSSVGRHLKGMLSGETIAHGHTSPGPPGACGLLLDGTGTVRIHLVRVTPLD